MVTSRDRGFWLALFLLAGLMLVSLTRYMYQYRRMEEVFRFAATQHAQLQATRQVLALALTATPDPETLDRLWRERTGQVQPGELPVRIQPPPQGLTLENSPPPPFPTREPPWKAWLRLFFGP